MKTSDFNYHLPPECIAQTPIEPRDHSRLMVLRRDQDVIDDAAFMDVGSYLKAGDLLVVNQTRVIPARLFARKVTGGKVELLLLKRIEPDVWEALVGGKGLKPGVKVTVENGPETEILEDLGASRRLIKFLSPIEALLPNVGEMPLPPYIHTPLANPDRYQTVYSKESGSAAAPTAGLHFTPRLMSELEAAGIQIAKVTLHVGLDTFMPVSEDNPLEHVIHSEWCEVTAETAELINRTKEKGGRVIAVGTTSVRTLESAAVGSRIPNQVSAISGPTQLFILPGFEFKVVDAMITNFHLPQSSLIMLVSAFAGREKVLNAYETAIQRGYRFYSFGDAMLIL
ncbi:MAG: tRNA preQ1(34) S-adenosylmethionine ribosyltransferase-isomerase QueA [Chloroflexi bacterium HGW-Chloroflexi-5]|jgi:S-adenosylmethionine:tRNA ribosyltransferase-isomerase|nr:MAG: tRNA preQ1(34) S-adenosylmethionine ribosyltransferase-isomerase QueA [Chloroflexi bacterium HGW-Chloroflexi-5]